MTVLVATRNKEKFAIISDLLKAVGGKTIQPFALFETANTDEVDETETTPQKIATQKARFFAALPFAQAYDFVLGMDDAIRIGDAEPDVDSKGATDRLLGGAYPTDTPVAGVSGYCLIDTTTKKERLSGYEIPYVFLGNPNGVTRKEGAYPLTRVLGRVGDKIPLDQLPDGEADQYFLKHARQGIEKLLSS